MPLLQQRVVATTPARDVMMMQRPWSLLPWRSNGRYTLCTSQTLLAVQLKQPPADYASHGSSRCHCSIEHGIRCGTRIMRANDEGPRS